jgi:ABC-type sugar transport system ATPase subunit
MAQGASSHPGEPAVLLEGVSKRFGSVHALSEVDLSLQAGNIHALIGQNGAGKSTCLGVIAGRIDASAGTTTVAGRRWPASMTPALARRGGVATIHQELTVLPAMTAVDNVFLDEDVSRLGLVRERDRRRRFAELSARLGVTIPAGARAGDLSLADQQMLEIMRALSGECRVLLLDEPTAALSGRERDALFSVMAELKARGVTLIFVSHYLDEVERHADTVTVFRDGRLIDSGPVAAWSRGRMLDAMLGAERESLDRIAAHGGADPIRLGEPRRPERLRVEGLTSRDGVRDVALAVRAGEIVGIAGLVGSGRTSLLHALSGAAPGLSGRMWIDGAEVPLPRTPRAAWRHGIRLIPEDRKGSGLFTSLSSRENMLLANLGATSRLGVVRGGRARRRAAELGREYGLRAGLLERPAGQLSGGNQQKLLLARCASCAPRVLLADEATRGIDVGAKGTILQTLRRLADRGLAIVLVSSELEEVAAASDRVYVLREGRVVAHLDGRRLITEQRMLDAAFEVVGHRA